MQALYIINMYSQISSLQTTDLSIIRNGWLSKGFELTDGKSVYGKLTYYGFFRRKAQVETAEDSWKFKFKSFFSRTILITETGGLQIAELHSSWFSRSALLQLTNGSVFKFSRPTFWKRQYVWTNYQQQELLNFKSKYFSKTLLKISVAKNSMPDPLLLLSFLGTHIILLKRREKAAAAH